METDYLSELIRIIECKDDLVTFLHNTKNKETADQILSSGFEFQSHLDYTTDVVSAKDPITIKYFTIVRQAYGKYTLIIQIGKDIIEDYSNRLHSLPHHFSEVLSVCEPYLGSEEDLIYTLAPQFVKGYINSESCKVVFNPLFNPHVRLPLFEENLKKILANPNPYIK